jgi:hypothetical protein
MIGKTPIDEHLKKQKALFDSVAWFEANTPKLKELVITLIQEKQLLSEGIGSDGGLIGTYSYWTEVLSGGRKQEGDPYNLNDTGEFFRSMYVKTLRDSISINADYAKMADKDWWSINILNLTDENLELYITEIKKNYISYARRVLELD